MDYISTQEAAERWGVSLRQVQRLLKDHRIPGARKYGVSWLIPAGADKPTLSPEEREPAGTGKPRKRTAPAESLCAAYPALYLHGGNLTGAYKRCQNEEERALLDAWLACYRGDAQKAGAAAAGILAKTKKPLVKLGCGVLLSTAALYAGDAAAWRAAVEQMESTRVPANRKHEKELAAAFAYICLEGRDVYPAWLETGALGVIDPELLPSAYQFYVKLLYIRYKEIDLLAVAEPLIAACAAQKKRRKRDLPPPACRHRLSQPGLRTARQGTYCESHRACKAARIYRAVYRIPPHGRRAHGRLPAREVARSAARDQAADAALHGKLGAGVYRRLGKALHLRADPAGI